MMFLDGKTQRRRNRRRSLGAWILQLVATAVGLVLQLRMNAHSIITVEAFPVVPSLSSSTRRTRRHSSQVLLPIRRVVDPDSSWKKWHGQKGSSFPDWRCFSQKSEDDSEDGGGAGMAEAFRRLDELSDFSLDDNDAGAATPAAAAAAASSSSSAPKTLIEAPPDAPTPLSQVTLEQEAKLYQSMARDLENTSEEDLYSDVMSDILGGGDSSAVPRPQRRAPQSPSPSVTTPELTSTSDTDALFNQALQEALQDVKLNNPSISDSVLDDKELMQEIEQIFERGNDELMANLEALRQEQRDLALISAEETATEAVSGLQAEARRLSQAEASMQTMLDRVGKESQQVELAAQDLRAAQAQLDGDFLYQVKTGGIVKQLSLVGMVLFSFRSIADTVSTLTDPASSGGLDSALLQGGIALLCALVFFVIK